MALALRADQTVRVASTGPTALSSTPWLTSPVRLRPAGPRIRSARPGGSAQVGADLASVSGFDAFFVSDVPVGAGQSSSAALESALAVALDEVWRSAQARELWCVPRISPRITSSEHHPGSWARRRPCSHSPTTRYSSTAAAVGPGWCRSKTWSRQG
ncbi:GHMP family kinase ATP-binding protein [Nocardioides luteus]|uniref:GHMP family kinase ATP-binding protein n=1 Tax=Nocardioides luteus TaxID=1844 RepID=UPI0035AFB631